MWQLLLKTVGKAIGKEAAVAVVEHWRSGSRKRKAKRDAQRRRSVERKGPRQSASP